MITAARRARHVRTAYRRDILGLNVGIKVMKNSDHNGINMHSCQPINNFVQDIIIVLQDVLCRTKPRLGKIIIMYSVLMAKDEV